jgi:hypothetical protein
MDPSCGYQMLWSLILIRFQSYEAIPLVIAFPSLSQEAVESDTDISRIAVQNKYYTGQFKKKVTLSHVYNEVTSEPTISIL